MLPGMRSTHALANGKRPLEKYGSAFDVITHNMFETFRGTLICTLVTFAFFPLYKSVGDNLWVPDEAERDRYVYMFWIKLVHFVIYFGVNGFFMMCDFMGWLYEYKLPRKESQKPAQKLVLQSLVTNTINQIVVEPLLLYYLYPYMHNRGMPAYNDPLPDFFMTWGHFAGALQFNDFFFYTTHRLMHEINFLYKHVHKIHHQYIGTIGFAAEHNHILENVFAAQFPTLGYCILFCVHPLIFQMWLTWRLEETYESHSGYCFLNTTLGDMGLLHGFKAAFHDYHHTRNKGNFGGPQYDELFGTQDWWLTQGGVQGQWDLKRRLHDQVMTTEKSKAKAQ
eukprot:Clim_evm151s147 gene=Clim_evmTU151s147